MRQRRKNPFFRSDFARFAYGLSARTRRGKNNIFHLTSIIYTIAPPIKFALGGLIGYDFGPVGAQFYVTHDLAQRNLGAARPAFGPASSCPLVPRRSRGDPCR